jgi:hypothetical protein
MLCNPGQPSSLCTHILYVAVTCCLLRYACVLYLRCVFKLAVCCVQLFLDAEQAT